MAAEGTFAELARVKAEKAARAARVPETPPVPEEPPPRDTAPPLPESAPVRETPPLSGARVDIAASFTKIPTEWFDRLAADTDPYTQAVYLQLVRLSWGHKREWCVVGYPRLAERANVSLSEARRAAKRLVRRGLLVQLGTDTSDRDPHKWGVRWRVLLPEGTPVRETAPSPETPPVRENIPLHRAPMKETPKESMETPPDVYELREMAARLWEASGHTLTSEALRARLRDTLTATGREATDELIDEATRGMG